MADQAGVTATPANGTPAAPDAARAAMIAALEKLESSSPDADPHPASDSTTPAPSDEDGAKVEAKAEAEPDAEAEADADPDETAEETPKAKSDPETEKRIAAVAKAEKRSREAIAAAKAELEQEREALKPKIEAAERYEQLKGRRDWKAALEHAGFTEDDYDSLAREVYGHGKAAAADPKNREYAARIAKEREQADRIAKLEKSLAAREEADAKAKAEAEQRRAGEEYLGKVKAAASPEHPLVSALLAKNPTKAAAEMSDIALRLFKEYGELPDPGDVVAAYEKQRRADLEELGVDVTAVIAKPAAASTKKTKPSKTLGTDVTAPGSAPEKTPEDPRAAREKLIRELEALDRAEAHT